MKLIYTNGENVKSINPFDLENHQGAWTLLGAAKEIKEDDIRVVSTLFAGLDARYKAMADLPFTIYGKGDQIVDNSDAYENKVGFLPNPAAFFGVAELSLATSGAGYFYRGQNRYKVVKQLNYWIPSTVTPKLNTDGTVEKFIRTENGKPKDYSPDDVLYFWLPDETVEAGPPNIYPLLSASVSAAALQSINIFVRDYMARGAVKAMILALDGNPPPEEAKRVETWFNTFMRGIKNVTWKAFNLSQVKPTIIGEGLEAIKDVSIMTDLKQNILESLGVPASLIAANWASREGNARKEDGRWFYSNTIMPDARQIQFAMNNQILQPMGYHLEFEPQRLEVFQTDESEKIAALSSLLDVMTKDVSPEKLRVAIEISGLTVTDEQMAALMREDEVEEPEPPEAEEPMPEDEMTDDLKKWERKAAKKIGRAVDFTSDAIPPIVHAAITAALPECKDAEAVRVLFSRYIVKTATIAPNYDSEILTLAQSLNKLAEAVVEKPN